MDSFDHDVLGRLTLSQRGIAANPDAASKSVLAYTGLGDLDYEDQSIADGTAWRTDYTHDQAGNRQQLTYPTNTVALTYVPTPLNQVASIALGGGSQVTYGYAGRMLDTRTTVTQAGAATYLQDWGYDGHRRVNALSNSVNDGTGPEPIANYVFVHDDAGNPLGQNVVQGLPDFQADDRGFTVDALNRLTDSTYFGSGETESGILELMGNREEHINRLGETTIYGAADALPGSTNECNEYTDIGGQPLTYDPAGNLTVDEEGRQYFYDEQNRLTQVKAAGGATVLANYTYDALGRRVSFNDPVAGVTMRYYYDGPNAIEERNASDQRLRYHVNGAQFVDERVSTFTASTPGGSTGSLRG